MLDYGTEVTDLLEAMVNFVLVFATHDELPSVNDDNIGNYLFDKLNDEEKYALLKLVRVRNDYNAIMEVFAEVITKNPEAFKMSS